MASDQTTKILLVDDQPANLAVLEAILADLGQTLVSVTSGEAALREVLAHDFAVVLLDVRMPTMNGFELAELIREHPRTHSLPIIFLTAGDADEFPLERAYALGAVDYLTKPLNPIVLRAKVAVFIDLYRKNAELARIEEDRHRAQLRSRDARLRLILDNIRDYAFIGTDVDRIVTEWEGGAAAITGWSSDDVRGRSADLLFTPEDAATGMPEQESRRALEQGRAEDRRWHLRRDGTRFFADGVMVPLRDEAGVHAGFAKIIRDATAEKLAAERLAESEQELDDSRREAEAERERLLRELQAASERMRDIFHRAPAIMCVMSGPDHVIEMANQRFLELAGGRKLAWRPVRAALPELAGQGFADVLDRVFASGEAVEGHNVRLLLAPAADGTGDAHTGLEEHFLDFVCMALREPDGSVSGVLLHGVDVTERARANLLAIGQRGALELAVTDAPLGDVLDVLARTAEDYTGGAALASVQLMAGGGRLQHAAAPSLAVEFQRALDAVPVGPVAGAAGSAAWQGAPIVCADIATDPLWQQHVPLAQAHGLRAARALPILAPSGAVLGTFTLYYRERRLPNPQEEAALALLANTASLVIGQRHEAAERQAAEHRSRAILESMSEGFIALDPAWRITYANGAAEAVTRRPREELVGAQFWDLFARLQGSQQERALRRTALERERSRIEAYDDAEGRWFEINSFPMEGGGGLALYFRDETDRRRAEEGIRRLAAVAEQSSDFIGIFTPDAGGIYLNPAGRRMAGLDDRTNIAAWRMIDFFPREDRPFVRDHVMAALTVGAAEWEGELRLAQPDGRPPLPVYFKGFAVRDADGNNIGLATITRDITAQKRAEDELRRVAADLSEADHRKSEFLATLAHELRNPLAPIRTGLDLLRMTPADKDALARIHAMMDRQLGHLIHLVDDLLDIARITRGKIELKRENVDLKVIAQMAVETSAALIESHGHRLDVDLPEEPLPLEADVTRMVQVLSNLLNNAAKYTPAGGRVALSAWREDGHAMVAVSDSGIGIPPDAIGSVFEMFTQVRGSLDRAQGGLGIGLSLVRRLVELHGGRVAAFSAGRGHGSTFTVRLPLHPGSPHARLRAPGDDAHARPPAPMRVLVVDDNADAADSLVALLEALGHTTSVARDGPEGLRLALEAQPDLVLLDIGLPGMSGYEVARAIRRNQGVRQIVLIALTGWGAQSDLQQSHEAGFDQHLTKPVSLEALEQALAAAARTLP
ncbi:response regulator [Massilia sp.]|uniref:response regulator n=1 Tax=Massilia sp. TaxID=1882437 RepID=UPI00352CF58B